MCKSSNPCLYIDKSDGEPAKGNPIFVCSGHTSYISHTKKEIIHQIKNIGENNSKIKNTAASKDHNCKKNGSEKKDNS